MKFFFDENISFRVAQAVQSMDDHHEIIHIKDKFQPGAPDQVWIPLLAKERDWIIISGDFNITRNREIRRIWKEAQLTSFFLTKGWMHQDKFPFVSSFMKAWPALVKTASTSAKGEAYSVQQNGKIKKLQP